MKSYIARLKKAKFNRGMTYLELIVVLSIFAATSSIAIFNHGIFQERVDIKNLASDIALKLVQAQKSAIGGKLPATGSYGTSWKPSYGVYFNLSSPGNNASFIYFADLNQSADYTDTLFCPTAGNGGECQEKTTMQNGNYISGIRVVYQNGTSLSTNDISINYTRPNSGATIRRSGGLTSTVDYAEFTISSPSGKTAVIKAFASGRIEII